MNKPELVSKVSRRSGYSKSQTREILDAFRNIVLEAVVEGEPVYFPGFFRIELKNLPATKRRDPVSGEVKLYPASVKAKIKLSNSIRNCANPIDNLGD